LLQVSKGKEEAEPEKEKEEQEDSGVSDSVDSETEKVNQAMADLAELDLPPPPAALCECHGLLTCANEEEKVFSTFVCGICISDFSPSGVRRFHSSNCHTFCCDDCLQDSLKFEVNNGRVGHLNCPSCGFHLTTKEVARRLGKELFLISLKLRVKDFSYVFYVLVKFDYHRVFQCTKRFLFFF
jgi:hypothetical protein